MKHRRKELREEKEKRRTEKPKNFLLQLKVRSKITTWRLSISKVTKLPILDRTIERCNSKISIPTNNSKLRISFSTQTTITRKLETLVLYTRWIRPHSNSRTYESTWVDQRTSKCKTRHKNITRTSTKELVHKKVPTLVMAITHPTTIGLLQEAAILHTVSKVLKMMMTLNTRRSWKSWKITEKRKRPRGTMIYWIRSSSDTNRF